MSKPLTTKQQYWLDHITAAQKAGLSLSEYAAQHHLSLKRLYNWRWTFSKQTPMPKPPMARFVKMLPPVASASINDLAVVAILPNGVRLHFAALTPTVLAMLHTC
jgi:hypothetical protein